MEARVNWHGGLSFKGQADTGFTVPLGAAAAVGGSEDGLRPMEMIAIGLAGCTAMDVISILTKKRQEVTDFEVQVHTEQAQEHPKEFTSAIIEYYVTGHNVKEAAVVRAIELSSLRYCPAQAMLGKIMPIELKYHIYKNQENGERKLINSGSYSPPAEEN
jgi:putative redox protein